MNIWPALKWLVPSGAVFTGIVGYIRKGVNDSRERRILDFLESCHEPVSVGIIQNEFIKHVLRGVKGEYLFKRLRPGGDPENEDDHLPPKRSIRATTRHWWRVKVMRELPTEEKVRDILRSLKSKGFVEFAGKDSWTLRRR